MSTAEHMPDEDRLRALLFGRRVVSVEMREERPPDSYYGYHTWPVGTLTLDDGSVLKVWGNEGRCACSAGDYPLTELNAVDNAITNVEVEERPDGDDVPCRTCGKDWCYGDDHERGGWYRIFVVAEDRHLLASFEGSDGNGYYGTGWWLTVENEQSGDAGAHDATRDEVGQ